MAIDAASDQPSVVALGRFWEFHGHSAEGRRWIDAALALPGDAPLELRWVATYWQADLAGVMGDEIAAKASAETAISIARDLGDDLSLAHSLHMLATQEEDSELAKLFLGEAALIYARLGLVGGVAVIEFAQANYLLREGVSAKAADLLERCLVVSRETGDAQGIAMNVAYLALAKMRLGDMVAARPLLRESLTLSDQLGYVDGVAICGYVLAEVALVERDPRRAAALLARSDGLLESIGSVLPGVERDLHEQIQDKVRGRLGTGQMRAIRGAVPEPDFREALAFALECLQ